MATTTLDDKAKEEAKKEFDEAVNMSASQLEKWLNTEESQSVGQKKDGDDDRPGINPEKKSSTSSGRKRTIYRMTTMPTCVT